MLVLAMIWAMPVWAAPPRPGIVAQLVEVRGGSFELVRVRRGQREFAATSYELLYPGDVLKISRPNMSAELEFSGGRGHTLRSGEPPFVVPDMGGLAWSWASLQRVLGLFPSVLRPPQAPRGRDTTPDGWRGGKLSPDDLLPLGEQHLTTAPDGVFLPVVWRGRKARVRLYTQSDSVVAQAAPDQAGRTLLYVPSLETGRYRLEIVADAKGMDVLSFPIHASPRPPRPHLTADDVAALVTRLKGPPEGRLQVLVELHAAADTDYMAFAVMRSVAGGYTP